MTHLSVCVITRNEEKNIERCLSSVSFADEIVVVDSGSTDRTVPICKRFTDRVYHRAWPGFGPQKDFCFSLAQGEWIFSVDADEIVPPALQREIVGIVRNPASLDGYYIKRKNFISGKWITHGGPFHNYPDHCLRMFRKKKGSTDGAIINEAISVSGVKGVLNNALEHHAYRDMEDYAGTMDYQASLSAVRAYQEKRGGHLLSRWINMGLRPVSSFIIHFFVRRALLQGAIGFRIARVQADYASKTYWRLNRLYRRFGKAGIPKETLQIILTPGRPWPILQIEESH